MTATTPFVVSRWAARAAVRASLPSSSTINSTFLPRRPPLALRSAASSSRTCFISAPSLANEPVSGAIKPILTVSWAWAMPARKQKAIRQNRIFFMLSPPSGILDDEPDVEAPCDAGCPPPPKPSRLAVNSRDSGACQSDGRFLCCGQMADEPGMKSRQTRGRVT